VPIAEAPAYAAPGAAFTLWHGRPVGTGVVRRICGRGGQLQTLRSAHPAGDEAELGLGGDGVDDGEDGGALVVGELAEVGEAGVEGVAGGVQGRRGASGATR
jgi:hypothetical protein